MKGTLEKIATSLGIKLNGKISPEDQAKLSKKLPADMVKAYSDSLGGDVSLDEALANTPTFKKAVEEAVAMANANLANGQIVATLEAEKATLAAEKVTLEASLTASQKEVTALSASPANDPAAQVVFGSGAAQTPTLFPIVTSHSHNIAAASTLAGISAEITTADLDVSQLKQEFGAVANLNMVIPIHQQIYQGFTSAPHFKNVHATAIYRSGSFISGNLIKQYTGVFESSKGFKIIPNEIINRHHQVDVEFSPVEIVSSWISGLYFEGKSPAQSPIVDFIYKQVILPKLQQEIEMMMVYKGEFLEGSKETVHAVDGIETILVKEAKEPTSRMHINKTDFDLATATSQQILDYVNAFSKKIPTTLKPTIKEAYCSASMVEAYLEAQKDIYNTGGGTNNIDFGQAKLPYSHIKLTAVDGMYDSPIIYCTVPNNQLILFNRLDHKTLVADIQVHKRSVLMMLDFWLAPGFAVNDFVVANVPSSYVVHEVAPASVKEETITTGLTV